MSVEFAQVSEGDLIPERELRFSRESVMAYAAAGGDHNRIHWDEAYAQEAGLPGVIAHGMLTMGSASAVVEDWAGPGAYVSAYRTKFTDLVPVPYAGDAVVEVSGVVKKVDAEARSAAVELQVTHEGTKVLGNARVTVQWR